MQIRTTFKRASGAGDSILQYKMIRTKDPFARRSDNPSAVYSIIVMLLEEDAGYESFYAYDVSRSRKQARALLKMLWAGGVFPANVREVLDEML